MALRINISKNKIKLLTYITFVPLITILLVIGVVKFNNTRDEVPTKPFGGFGQRNEVNNEDNDASVLFYEMTIPSLKSRSYNSNLNNLTKLSETSSFETYLTSYDSDGFNINGSLIVPKGNKPSEGWPAVIFVHGYIPPTVYRTESNYNSFVNALASQGVVVFKIDLRGHANSEGVAHGAYYSGDYVVDALNAHSALEKYALVDSTKIGLWGHSMGGNVVFRSFVASEKISKVVVWAGAVFTYSDFQEYRISDGSYRPPADQTERQRRRDLLFETHGTFDPGHEFWKMIPATNYLSGKQGAVQIHHPVDDNVVSISYSRNLAKVLAENNFEYQLFEYPSGGHNLTGSTFTQAIQRMAEFLKSD